MIKKVQILGERFFVSRTKFSEEKEIKKFEEEKKAIIEKRREYLWDKGRPIVPLKFDGYWIEANWVKSSRRPDEVRLNPETDKICPHYRDNPVSWWHEGMTIQDLF